MDERMRILKQVEAGEISVEEAIRQINEPGQLPPAAGQEPAEGEPAHAKASGTGQAEAEPAPQEAWGDESASAPPLDAPKGLVGFWRYPLYGGVGLIVVGALLLYATYGALGWGLWAVCGWPLFALGVVVAALSGWMREARWLHVRVSGKDRVAISLPLPLRLTGWIVRAVRPFVPQFRDTGLDEVIMGLSDAVSKDGQPVYVDVNDDETGEHVQVYLG